MLTLALGLVIEALLQARHALTRLAFGLAIGMGLLVLFTLRQRKQEQPMLDPAVFASHSMMSVAALIVAVSIGYWAVLVYLPLFLNTAFGWTLQEAGIGLLAATLPMLLIPSLNGHIAVQLGWRRLSAIALMTMAIGGIFLGVAAVAQTMSAVAWVISGMVVLGAGAALANPQLPGAVLVLAPPAASGMASANAVIARQGGFAIGVGALGDSCPLAVLRRDLCGSFARQPWRRPVARWLASCFHPHSATVSFQDSHGQSLPSGKRQPQRRIAEVIEYRTPMCKLSHNAQLVSDVFDEIAKGNSAPFWNACHQDVVWRTIGDGSWSGEFSGKQSIIDEVFRPLNHVLAERATIPTRIIDGEDVIVLQARGKNLTRDGQRYDNDYVFVIHFKDGKIVRYEEYCDTELIARVLPDRVSAKSIPISK